MWSFGLLFLGKDMGRVQEKKLSCDADFYVIDMDQIKIVIFHV